MSDEINMPEMYKIVCSLLSRTESAVFREPVDWKALGLNDYPEIVKKPMDLGTVKKRMENKQYSNIEEIATDIRQVWQNCMLYNRDGSEYYHLAEQFSVGFENAFSALRRLDDSKKDMERLPTLEERMQLSYDLFKLDNNEMCRVFTMIEASSCPNALCRKSSLDEVLINLDALNPRCFHEVNAFTMQCVLNSSGGKKRKLNKGGEATGESTKKLPKAKNA